jgi:hypothetical protein
MMHLNDVKWNYLANNFLEIAAAKLHGRMSVLRPAKMTKGFNLSLPHTIKILE